MGADLALDARGGPLRPPATSVVVAWGGLLAHPAAVASAAASAAPG